MILRYALRADEAQMKEFYKRLDLNFPAKFLTSFVVEDENVILAGGGINPLPELSLAMNPELPGLRKGRILRMVLDLIDGNGNLGPFYVFVNDEKWEEQLKGYGFREAKGKVLIYG